LSLTGIRLASEVTSLVTSETVRSVRSARSRSAAVRNGAPGRSATIVLTRMSWPSRASRSSSRVSSTSQAVATEGADHQRAGGSRPLAQPRVELRSGGRAQRAVELVAVLQDGQRGAGVAGPVAEGDEPAAVAVHHRLDVQQRPAAGHEPPQHLPAARLSLVRVAEEHVRVPQRPGLCRRLLQPEHDGVRRRVRPAAGRHDPAAGRRVVLRRPGALRGLLHGDRDAAADQRGRVAGHDRDALLDRGSLLAQPQMEAISHVVVSCPYTSARYPHIVAGSTPAVTPAHLVVGNQRMGGTMASMRCGPGSV
jgi:hypothetical protein